MRTSVRTSVFILLWLFVAATSAIDLAALVYNAEGFTKTPALEFNPWGRWLIATGGVTLFAGVKSFSQSVVLAGMVAARQRWQKLVDIAIAALAACQVALMWFIFTD